MNLVAQSFAWPLRGRWQASWAIGVVALLLLPVGFIPLLGYAVEATRTAAVHPASGPPRWRLSRRLLAEGILLAVAIALLTAPFALVAIPLAGALASPGLWHSTGTLLHVEAWVSAALIMALPWGVVMLLLMPHSTARYAAGGKARDLFDFSATVRDVGRDFSTWNVAVAAIVTAWAIGLACAGLLCVGIVPGMYYAILVSAHATAALHPEGAHSSAR